MNKYLLKEAIELYYRDRTENNIDRICEVLSKDKSDRTKSVVNIIKMNGTNITLDKLAILFRMHGMTEAYHLCVSKCWKIRYNGLAELPIKIIINAGGTGDHEKIKLSKGY